MKDLFALRRSVHGKGAVTCAWDRSSSFLASCGVNRRLHIHTRSGELYDEFPLETGSNVTQNTSNANSSTTPAGSSSSGNSSTSVRPIQIEWDAIGEHVAILQENHTIIHIYNIHTKKNKPLDTNLKDGPSFLCWTRASSLQSAAAAGGVSGAASNNATNSAKSTTNAAAATCILAIGSAKGNLVLYDVRTSKSISVAGKHSKRITCGMWNGENKLALAAQDRMLTISSADGTLIEQAKLKYEPSQIQYAIQKNDGGLNSPTNASASGQSSVTQSETTVSINMGHQTILLYNMSDSDNPVELAFQSKYGDIVSYAWFGDGYILLGFSRGHVIAISTHMKEIGEELQSCKVFDSQLTHLRYCEAENRVCCVGDNSQVRIIDMNDWKELRSEQRSFSALKHEEGEIDTVEWSPDGQLLTFALTGGVIYTFLMKIPSLAAAAQHRLLYLTSLKQVTLVDCANDAHLTSVDLPVEPSLLALSCTPTTRYAACAAQSRVWVYEFKLDSPNDAAKSTLVYEKEMLGTIKQVALSDSILAVLSDGNVFIQQLASTAGDAGKLVSQTVSYADSGDAVTHMCMTTQFLVVATQQGRVIHISLELAPPPESSSDDDQTQVAVQHSVTPFVTLNEYTHSISGGSHAAPFHSLQINSRATRVLLCDASHRYTLVSPLDNSALDVSSQLPSSIDAVLFDTSTVQSQYADCLVACDIRLNRQLITLVYTSTGSRGGPTLQRIGMTKLVSLPQFTPALLRDGCVHGQRASGALVQIILASHDALVPVPAGTVQRRSDDEQLKLAFQQTLALNRLQDAFLLSLRLNAHDVYTQLARRCVDQLAISLACRVYRQLHDVSMCRALARLAHIEDVRLLAGHVCVLQHEYERASKLFLASSEPIHALQLRRDLNQFDAALKLALTLAPHELPYIAREYAVACELKADFATALEQYSRALQMLPTSERTTRQGESHVKACNAGICRMTLRLGDLIKGRQLAIASQDTQLQRECGMILESMRQYADAAELYALAHEYERGFRLYCTTKQLRKAAAMLPQLDKQVKAGVMTVSQYDKLLALFARTCEDESDYAQAMDTYNKITSTRRHEFDVVRLALHPKLDRPQVVFTLTRRTRDTACAQLIVTYCLAHNDFESAIEFLLMTPQDESSGEKKTNAALAMALKHGKMSAFCRVLESPGSTLVMHRHDYATIAQYFEKESSVTSTSTHKLSVEQLASLCQSAVYHGKSLNYTHGLSLLIKHGADTTPCIDTMIALVASAHAGEHPDADTCIRTLHAYLLGENDGRVKDLQFIFKLYMGLREYSQASQTACLIAQQEQSVGNYSNAHSILFTMSRDLQTAHLPVPSELYRALLLLHSYLLAKRHSVKGQHGLAARMLIRVSRNISHFPAHTVPILTSTVIECQRAGLKKSSFEFASLLMRPEHRHLIDAKYRKPIEAFVRRPVETEADDTMSECPYCNDAIPDCALQCTNCANQLPYCVSTGRHMIRASWSQCAATQSCGFPSLYDEQVSQANANEPCNMCGQALDVNRVVRVTDVSRLLSKKQAPVAASDPMQAQQSSSSSTDKNGSSEEQKQSTHHQQQQSAVDIAVKL